MDVGSVGVVDEKSETVNCRLELNERDLQGYLENPFIHLHKPFSTSSSH